jgi:membrane associated rhomboid family serine protease/Zn-finger nucleic acid-binding protein
MLGAALVRRLTDPATWGALWRQRGQGTVSLGCPSCCEPMREVTSESDGQPLTLDVCSRCHVFWLDRGEPEGLQATRARAPAAVVAPRPDVSFVVEPLDEPEPMPDFGITNPWARLAHHAGLPIAHDGARLWFPLTTVSVALLILAGAILSAALPALGEHLAFVPAQPLHLGGLPLLVAPWLHGSLLSGLVNLAFFVFLADNLEQFLGWARLLALIAAAALLGQVGQAMWTSTPTEPVLGCDPVVTALSVFFGLSFYRAHLDFLLGLHRPWHLFSVPVWAVIALWTLVAVADMFAGASAHLLGAHLAAAAVAVIAKWAYFDRAPQA